MSTPMDTTSSSFDTMETAMTFVLKHLNKPELIAVSRVCSAWNKIAMDPNLWRIIVLKDVAVYNWHKLVETINKRGTRSLDCRHMIIPETHHGYLAFWTSFSDAIQNAEHLKVIKFSRCSTLIIEYVIHSLPQLEIFCVYSVCNKRYVFLAKTCMFLSLQSLGLMTNLTQLKLSSHRALKLTAMPNFENLIHLNTLSLTNIKSFPDNFLETVSTGLKILHFGNCNNISERLVATLTRFTKLCALRLENCLGQWKNIEKHTFVAIRSFKELVLLELINIEFDDCTKRELEKCVNFTALLIIPVYNQEWGINNILLIRCLKKLSRTLTYFIWGFTNEVLLTSLSLYNQSGRNVPFFDYRLEPTDHDSSLDVDAIPIIGDMQSSPVERPYQPGDFHLLTIPSLKKLLETLMQNTKSKVIKVPRGSLRKVKLIDLFQ